MLHLGLRWVFGFETLQTTCREQKIFGQVADESIFRLVGEGLGFGIGFGICFEKIVQFFSARFFEDHLIGADMPIPGFFYPEQLSEADTGFAAEFRQSIANDFVLTFGQLTRVTLAFVTERGFDAPDEKEKGIFHCNDQFELAFGAVSAQALANFERLQIDTILVGFRPHRFKAGQFEGIFETSPPGCTVFAVQRHQPSSKLDHGLDTFDVINVGHFAPLCFE
jgi:hypothetical protein